MEDARRDPTAEAALDVVAPADAAGGRVDRFLAETIGTMSRARIKSLVEVGRVSRDGAVLSQASEAVRAGSHYRIVLPPPRDAVPRAEPIALSVLFEDDHLIVLDKQAGLVTHPAPGNEVGTLVNALLAHCGPDLPGIGGERRPGIVHRLDKDTSGVMVVAKSEQALAKLGADFAARQLERAYLAFVWGVPETLEGRWEGAIGRDPRDRKRMAVVLRGGKPAATNFRRLDNVGDAVSLLRLRLETGRTHQIRVHAATFGHPVVGDPVYLRRIPAASRTMDAKLRTLLLDFPRQALHAERLAFDHPISGERLMFLTPPPADFASLLSASGATVSSQD